MEKIVYLSVQIEGESGVDRKFYLPALESMSLMEIGEHVLDMLSTATSKETV